MKDFKNVLILKGKFDIFVNFQRSLEWLDLEVSHLEVIVRPQILLSDYEQERR